jgi:hypothetical protein
LFKKQVGIIFYQILYNFLTTVSAFRICKIINKKAKCVKEEHAIEDFSEIIYPQAFFPVKFQRELNSFVLYNQSGVIFDFVY